MPAHMCIHFHLDECKLTKQFTFSFIYILVQYYAKGKIISVHTPYHGFYSLICILVHNTMQKATSFLCIHHIILRANRSRMLPAHQCEIKKRLSTSTLHRNVTSRREHRNSNLEMCASPDLRIEAFMSCTQKVTCLMGIHHIISASWSIRDATCISM